MTEAEKERAALEALFDHVNSTPDILRLTKYRAVSVTLNPRGDNFSGGGVVAARVANCGDGALQFLIGQSGVWHVIAPAGR